LSWDNPIARFGSGMAVPRYHTRFFGDSGVMSPSIGWTFFFWFIWLDAILHPSFSHDQLLTLYAIIFNGKRELKNGKTLFNLMKDFLTFISIISSMNYIF
jgi:hypothetical protein